MRKIGRRSHTSRPETFVAAIGLSSLGLSLGLSLVLSLWLPVRAVANAPAKPSVKPTLMRACASCHPKIYRSYTRHGMSRSLGPVKQPPKGRVKNPKSGWNYQIVRKGKRAFLQAHSPDGGVRKQLIVGQIGAGIFDKSWATAELHPVTEEPINRLFFAPVETVTGHGLELSPFEHAERPAAVNMALTSDCLVCHTDTAIYELPAASSHDTWVAPGHALGVDAFAHLQPLGCAACHGDPRGHMELMNGQPSSGRPDLAVIADLPPAQQRDICARCHLQGDTRFQMVKGRPTLGKPLAAQFPTLITTEPTDDFRFVGQIERLSLSECFKNTPTMTCTTCHDPHTGVKTQGLASFEKACRSCHAASTDKTTVKAIPGCSRPAGMRPTSITGNPARSKHGCIDCHVRRSQPFDLPGIRSVDHFIRARIPSPQTVPFRDLTNPNAPLKIWDDGRLTQALATEAGKRWQSGILAMAMVQTGRFTQAVGLFERFPSPGSAESIRPTAPPPLSPVETWPTFHQLRAMALLAAKKPQMADKAFGDAVRLDSVHPGALMGRARVAILSGDLEQAMHDSQRIIEVFPASESPWQLRALIAQHLRRPDFQIVGLEAVVKRWPSDAGTWLQLAQLYRAQGQIDKAERAISIVRRLRPSLLQEQP